jgi:virulence factor Mce-like protein
MSTPRKLLARWTPGTLIAGAVTLALLLAGAVAGGIVLTGGAGSYTITAQFPATPGLYPHNRVDILGVGTGTVQSVTPRASHVDVVLSLPARVKLPREVKAVLMVPNPVSDRSVELTPPYTGGPTLAHGATIPLSRTAVPLELDDIYTSVQNLSRALGPEGANSGGELSAALHALARLAGGNGEDVHAAIDAVASALPALTENPDQLAKLIDGLDRLTGALAARSSTLDSLYGNLAAATGQLADDRHVLASAIANLQVSLQQVSDFLDENKDNLGTSVRNLSDALAAVMTEQQSLIKTFDTAPLGFQNFVKAIDTGARCPDGSTCTGLFGRLDLTSDAAAIVQRYCGSIWPSIYGLFEYSANLPGGKTLHTLCAAEIGLLQKQPGPPGAPAAPDLDLAHYLGER